MLLLSNPFTYLSKMPHAPTVDHPLTRDGKCAVKGCGKAVRQTRETRAGWWVSYCEVHERQASELFDWDGGE